MLVRRWSSVACARALRDASARRVRLRARLRGLRLACGQSQRRTSGAAGEMRSVRDTTYTLLRRAGPRSRSRTGGGVPMLGTAYTARAPGPRPLLWHNICIFAPACACAQQMCRARARAPVAWIDARSAGVQLYRVCTRHEANFAMGSCALGGTGNANVERSARPRSIAIHGHTYTAECTDAQHGAHYTPVRGTL